MKTATQKKRNNDSRNDLTALESRFNIPFVAARFNDIVLGLTHQSERDIEAVQETQDELNKLRPMYQRYRELNEQLKSREERAQIVGSLLISLNTRVRTDDEKSMYLLKMFESFQDAGIGGNLEPNAWPLWKLLREVVRQIPEIQVVDAEGTLRALGIKTSRQAVESAIATHRDVFSVRMRGREKYISLKGA